MLARVRQHLVVDVQVVPLRQERQHVRVDPVDVAGRVLGEHHALGVAAPAHLHQRVRPGLERDLQVDPEPVHAEREPGVGQFREVVAVGGVAAVAEYHPAGVDPG